MTRRGRRLVMIAAALGVVGAAVGLALYALSDNIVFFYSPSELAAKNVAMGAHLRIGGLVAARLGRQVGRRPARVFDHRRIEAGQGFLRGDAARPVSRRPGRRGRGNSRGAGGVSRGNDSGQARRALHAARGRRFLEETGPLARGADRASRERRGAIGRTKMTRRDDHTLKCLPLSPPRSYGEGPGVGLSGVVEASPRGLRKRSAPHPLPPPRKDGEGSSGSAEP